MIRPFVEEPKGSVANYPYFERGKDSITAYLYRLFQERIVMFDGAMGTMIQKYKLGEEEYRGERFKVRRFVLPCFYQHRETASLLGVGCVPSKNRTLRAQTSTTRPSQ